MRFLIIASLVVAPAASAQTLPARPVVTIGGAMANTNDEPVKITGARRLPDGRIVVALGDPIELRVYDAAGRLVRRIGRKGGGPGEFRGAISIPYADNDSIVTFADNYHRATVFHPDGTLIHGYDETAASWPPPLLHRAFLRAPGGVVNGCARAVMMALPLATPANLYEVIPDRSGHFWAHALGDRQWRVYALAGSLLGIVTLPPDAAVLDLGANYMLTESRDDDGFEQVIEYRVNVPTGSMSPPCAARRDSFPLTSTDVARINQLKQVLRDAMKANELVYSNVAHYPRTDDSLQLKLPAAIRVRVIEASRQGYADAALDTRSTLFCVIRVGTGSFAWPDMVTSCGN